MSSYIVDGETRTEGFNSREDVSARFPSNDDCAPEARRTWSQIQDAEREAKRREAERNAGVQFFAACLVAVALVLGLGALVYVGLDIINTGGSHE